MKFLMFPILMMFTLSAAWCQTPVTDTTKRWTVDGFATLNLNQASFKNWAAGGQNSFSATAIGNLNWKYAYAKHTWENQFNTSLGYIWTKQLGLQKNEDKIDLLSKYGYDLKKKFFLTTLMQFKTQYADGFNYPDDSTLVSTFMAPAYLLISLGIDYKPVKWFSFYLSPATGKFTFVTKQILADQGAYGVEPAVLDESGNVITPGKKARAEFGAYANVTFNKEIVKNVTVLSRLDLFNNYTDKKKDNRKNIDVNWETTINFVINKYLTTSLLLHLIYDNDINLPIDDNDDGIPDRTGQRTQFKEVLGIGVSYKFGGKDAKKP